MTRLLPPEAKVTLPGLCAALEDGVPPGKVQAWVKTVSPASGSVQLPLKLTEPPAAMVVAPVGAVMVAVGAWFTGVPVTVMVRVFGVGSASPCTSVQT